MKFRLKITFCMLALLSILFGIGGSVLIVSSFQDTMEQEKVTAENTYKMLQVYAADIRSSETSLRDRRYPECDRTEHQTERRILGTISC